MLLQMEKLCVIQTPPRMGRDGMGWDGMGWDGMGRGGTGWDSDMGGNRGKWRVEGGGVCPQEQISKYPQIIETPQHNTTEIESSKSVSSSNSPGEGGGVREVFGEVLGRCLGGCWGGRFGGGVKVCIGLCGSRDESKMKVLGKEGRFWTLGCKVMVMIQKRLEGGVRKECVRKEGGVRKDVCDEGCV
ncbi:hypothetical protein C8J55DRAFT_485742 [Lentinula edodes]|uniref:Uncharacterized protein n=1 Tax=Lentinula lateritia TaxID=40482 RepID=A0A9W9DZ59_9AGAR|nr:hypothetical protein C8J55DRAFT_485742 [Lentinula edodes]